MPESSTVAPNDSVSQNGSGAALSGFASDGVGYSAAVDVSVNLLRAYELMDATSYSQYASIVGSCVAGVDRTVSLQCGALRVNSAKTVVSSSSRSSGGSSAWRTIGGGRARSGDVRALKSWRPSAVPSGFCYTKLLRTQCAEAVSSVVGEWPSVSTLLKLPAAQFQSVAELERFRFTGSASSVHVLAGGQTGCPLLPALARVAQGLKTQPGTFGAVVRASALSDVGAGPKLSTKTCVGGMATLVSLPTLVSMPAWSEGAVVAVLPPSASFDPEALRSFSSYTVVTTPRVGCRLLVAFAKHCDRSDLLDLRSELALACENLDVLFSVNSTEFAAAWVPMVDLPAYSCVKGAKVDFVSCGDGVSSSEFKPAVYWLRLADGRVSSLSRLRSDMRADSRLVLQRLSGSASTHFYAVVRCLHADLPALLSDYASSSSSFGVYLDVHKGDVESVAWQSDQGVDVQAVEELLVPKLQFAEQGGLSVLSGFSDGVTVTVVDAAQGSFDRLLLAGTSRGVEAARRTIVRLFPTAQFGFV